MTVILVSLFLPKTVYFNLPEASDRPRITKPPSKRPSSHDTQPNLFEPQPTATLSLTPESDECAVEDELFSNEDGLRANFGLSVGDQSSKWGRRRFQPSCRANTPAPTSTRDQHDRTLEKAHELGRQGQYQPRTTRSDSHDRVFAKANWHIVNADQGNAGLRNAAAAAQREGLSKDHVWIGTLGMPTDALDNTQQKQEIHDRLTTEFDMYPVFVRDKEFNGHYLHFCKKILWPVFHYQLPDNPKSKSCEDQSWDFYVHVNKAFANIIVKHWKRGDTIWINDYHLLLLPGLIREKLPEAKIGLSLHVAFPSCEVFRCLAVRKKLLEGMLGANLICFQIAEYTRHFLHTCSRILALDASSEGIQLEDRFVNVTHHAIGIDPVNLNDHRQDSEVKKWIDIMRERYQDMKIIVARDKLDRVRGVRQKLLSYELFLNQNPSWRGHVVLVQVAPSTSDNSDLEIVVGDIVTRINSAWANLSYQPVTYLKQDIPYPQYLALLSIADAIMITSQREGMNLTSHEFVVCQDGALCEKKHGSLILSEFTGTTSILGGNELSVNPWSYRQCAESIKKAVEMTAEEKALRWATLREVISHHSGAHWFGNFLSRLNDSYDTQHRQDQTSVPRLNMDDVTKQYRESRHRLFLLDLEGTLVPGNLANDMLSSNPQRVLTILNNLIDDSANVVFVMSARRPDELERFFRLVPNLGLVAENGCFVRHVGETSWTEFVDRQQVSAWKQSVRSTLQYYLARTPGSEIEDRNCSLLFHYKNAEDAVTAERQAGDWTAHINESEREHHHKVHATQLDHCVVVQPSDWSKDAAADQVYRHLKAEGRMGHNNATPNFLMVVGDGREDEKVFRWANQLLADKEVENVITVSISGRNTEASATLTQGVSGVLATLQNLARLS
ncbi:family 20 glycosyltransferase [Xylariaceae sp. FL0255]|nr:family 20 glycosyltransferase [Xylariaceae sp. FL0255]